jgi:hypothetical protein
MKWKKILLAGVIVGILSTIWGGVTCGWLFNWVYKLEPSSIWKLPEEIPFILMSIMGIVFAKGLCFGLLVWLVGSLPGNFSLGIFSAINQTVIIYWIIWGLVTSLWQGLIIAAIYK